LDLLIGTAAGRIEYWRNEGSSTNFLPTLVTNQLAGIKIDANAIPRPVDLNGDGLIELALGEYDYNGLANVLHYKNDGTISSPNLVLETGKLIPIETREYTIPYFYDWNEDGKLDLIIGGKLPELILYRNTALDGQFPDSSTLILESIQLPGYKDGRGLSVDIVDIDGDGDDDVFIGENNGGINFYRRVQ
ncbi:MAG: VCBS repeat-containing protein, partial [candidate division Zixibacteria bacterium]